MSASPFLPSRFPLRGGIERRLDELARQHRGAQVRWSIRMEILHNKSGSPSPVKAFQHHVLKFVKNDYLPGYSLTFDAE